MDSARRADSKFIQNAGPYLAWTYRVFALIGGLALIGQNQLTPGAVLMASGAISAPPAMHFIQSQFRVAVPIWLQIAATFSLLLIAGAMLPNAEIQKSQKPVDVTPAFVPDPRGVAMAKFLLLDDFNGYLQGKKVVGNWTNTYPLNERVSAEQLYVAYHNNEVSADARFKDKSVAVSGTIFSINKGMFDDVYLVLNDENEFESVQAILSDDSAKQAAQFVRGSDIALLCTGNGMTLGSPILKDCQTTDVILAQKRSDIENLVDQFFSGSGESLESSMRTMIGFGYSIGVTLPPGNPCETASPVDMTACNQQLKTGSREKLHAAYNSLAQHFPLPKLPPIRKP